MTDDEHRRIIALRVLIARAAASDSLRWWDDESLSDAGLALAGRLFSRQPATAARHLALRAARVRHHAALSQMHGVIHLFDLGAEIELALAEATAASKVEIPFAMRTPDELRHQLAAWGIDDEPNIQRRIGAAIELASSPGASPLERASLLAAGYLHGDVGEPVFPYLKAHGAPV